MAQLYDMPLEELKKYKPALTKQKDFDEFWEKSLKELAEIPLKYQLIPYDFPARRVKVSELNILVLKVQILKGGLPFPREKGCIPGLYSFTDTTGRWMDVFPMW